MTETTEQLTEQEIDDQVLKLKESTRQIGAELKRIERAEQHWKEKLKTWSERQHGSAGWEMKLESFIESVEQQAVLAERERMSKGLEKVVTDYFIDNKLMIVSEVDERAKKLAKLIIAMPRENYTPLWEAPTAEQTGEDAKV